MAEQPGQLMSIGYVAAHNVAQSIGKPELANELEQAIKDEINAMSSHFTLAFADIQNEHELVQRKLKAEYDAAVAEIQATWTYVRGNRLTVAAVLLGTLALGVVLGHFVA
jgi:hypothetical protein